MRSVHLGYLAYIAYIGYIIIIAHAELGNERLLVYEEGALRTKHEFIQEFPAGFRCRSWQTECAEKVAIPPVLTTLGLVTNQTLHIRIF